MEFYTHRSGRTARAGKKGISVAMINKRELGKVKQIEKTLKSPFKRMLIPSGPEVCQKQLLALMHKVHVVKVNEDAIEEFLPAVYEEFKDLSKNELIKRFASIEFNRFLDYYKNAPDLNEEHRKSDVGGGSSEDRHSTGSRFFINLGKMDNIDVSKLLEMLDDFCGIQKKDVGKIDLKGAYSFFEVEKEKTDAVMKGIHGIEYQGRQVRVELTERKTSSRSSGGERSRSSDDSGSKSRGGGGYKGGSAKKSYGKSSNGGAGRGSDQKKRWGR
jgi:ATP-dependent RNA helicase DeaD